MTREYRKKPVVVEAVRWTGENHGEMCEFIDPEVFEMIPHVGLVIHTLEGDHRASPGDYIIKGVNGEFYPCKPDVFEKTYEPATFTPPNEPLTLEKLENMEDTTPVWWDQINSWVLVYKGNLTTWSGKHLYAKGCNGKFYHRPPEGEEEP